MSVFYFLLAVAKIAFLVYLLINFTKPKTSTYLRTSYYTSATFLGLALVESLISSIPFLSLIVWGFLTYLYRKEYLAFTGETQEDNNY